MTISKEQIQALQEAAESQIGILENIAGYEPDDIDGDDVELRFETEDGFDTGCNVSIVEQCQKSADVIRSLLAEREADKALIAEQQRKLIHREFLLETADQVQKEYAEALGCAGDNESILEAIDGLQEQVRTIDMSNGVLNARVAELEPRALTVKLPPRAPDNFGAVLEGYEKWLIATTFRDTWNACLSEVTRINAAGITLVVGGE